MITTHARMDRACRAPGRRRAAGSRLGALLAGAVLGACATLAVAADNEVVVEAPIVATTPVMGMREHFEEVGDCAPAAPLGGGDLLALLRWDLRVDCRSEARREEYVEGWRVSWRWEDQVYSRVVDEHPGDTMRLKLTLH